MIRNVPELGRTRSLLATKCAPINYVEIYSGPTNLESVSPYVLLFCHNSRYLNERKTELKFKTVLCACICMMPEAVYDVETSDFTSFPDVKKGSEFHSLCPF